MCRRYRTVGRIRSRNVLSAEHSLHPLACPFNLCVERLSLLAGRSPMNGVGADIIKVFGIAFFQKGEVLYLVEGFYVCLRFFSTFDVNSNNICNGCNCNWFSSISYWEDEK